MSEVIDNVEDEVFKTDPVSGKPTNQVIPLKVIINLQNRLEQDVDIDLQFTKGYQEHQRMFSKEYGFTDQAEQDMIMGLVEKINVYESTGQRYTIYEGWNHSIYMKNLDTNEETFMKVHPNALTYIKEILDWIYAQEQWLTYQQFYPGV
jgi:hypothetical protein